MTLPNFLDSAYCDFRHKVDCGVTDFNTTLATLTDLLVTQPAAGCKWTENPAGTFQSQNDTSGRFIKLVFTRISATNLQMQVIDHNAVTICTRRIQTDSGRTIRVYTGKFYCMIEAARATPECFVAFLVDPTPEPLASVPNPSFGIGFRTSGDVSDGLGGIGYLYAIDNVAVANVRRAGLWNNLTALNYWSPLAPTGRFWFSPLRVSQNISTVWHWAGQMPQTLYGSGDIPPGVIVRIPIDDGVIGEFMATEWGIFADLTALHKIYMRVG